MIGYAKLTSPDAYVICTIHGTVLGSNGKKARSPEYYWKLATEYDAQRAAQTIARDRKKKYCGYIK